MQSNTVGVGHGCVTYDNPTTLNRECYLDGKLLGHLSMEVIDSPPPGERFRKWQDGRIHGDALSLPPEILGAEVKCADH